MARWDAVSRRRSRRWYDDSGLYRMRPYTHRCGLGRVRNKTISFKLLPVLLVVVVLVIVLVSTRPVKQPPLRELPPVRVETVPVRTVDLSPRVAVTGYLRPARKSTLHFELAGRVVARQVEAGQEVAAGAVLLALDDGDYRDALQEAQAQLEQARAAVARDRRLLEYLSRNRKLQERELARLQRLGQESLSSQSKRDATQQRLLQLQADEERLRYEVGTAAARLALREAALSRARRNLARTQLKAPYGGVVNAVFLEAGDYVTPATAAVELVQLDALDLRLAAGSEAVAALHPAQQVTVEVGERRLQGRIVALQQDPDPRSFTHEVRVRVPGQGLQAGRPGRAFLPLRPLHGVQVVPVSAVLRDGGRSYVFLVENGVVRQKSVVLGRREGDLQVVRRGLEDGGTVVARDVALLSDGQKVQPATDA